MRTAPLPARCQNEGCRVFMASTCTQDGQCVPNQCCPVSVPTWQAPLPAARCATQAA